jgi:hypothetical protein
MNYVAIEQLREKIQQETQQLIHCTQVWIKQGLFSIIARKGDYIYSYNLWVLNSNNDEQVVDTDEILSNNTLVNMPLGPQFYEELLKSLFPNSRGMKCYELYTLHLGIVKADIVAKNLKKLCAVWLSGTSEASSEENKRYSASGHWLLQRKSSKIEKLE